MHTVIETSLYLADAKQAGVSDGERQGIVDMLAADPTAGELIVGTGGARKVRYAKAATGKSGGYRVITYFAADDVPVFLLAIYGKGQKGTLTGKEKVELAKILAKIAPAYRESAKGAASTMTKTKRRTE